jgi:hypothetical protein
VSLCSWSFPWRRLINGSWTATLYAVEKSSRWSALSTNIYRISTVGRELSPVVQKALMLRKKRYQNIDWIGATRGDFLPSGTLFLGSSEQGKWEIWHTVLVVIWLVEVVFYYHLLLLSIRHLSQGKRRKWPQKNRSTKCWDKARHQARTPRNFIGGNPTGSAVKTNGREGTRTSGSSKGSPELGLANDSRELLNAKKRRMPCSCSPSFGLISWKLHGLDETQYNAGAQYVARRVQLTDRVPIFNRKVRAIISRSLTAKFYHAKRANISINSKNCVLANFSLWSRMARRV